MSKTEIHVAYRSFHLTTNQLRRAAFERNVASFQQALKCANNEQCADQVALFRCTEGGEINDTEFE